MKTPITPVRAAAPQTIEELAQTAYQSYVKEQQRLGNSSVLNWSSLSRDTKKAWQQAASTIASQVAFAGCPRPMDPAGDTREASRSAEWLLHIADGGDPGSEAQLRMLLRTAAGLLVRPITPQAQQSGAAMESVLVDGVAYHAPMPVAAELLRLHLELQTCAARAGAQAVLIQDHAKRLIGDVVQADELASAVCRTVAEFPDRDSPADWPEAMLVTSDELHRIVREAIFDATPAAVSAPQPQPAPKTFDELPLATCAPSIEEWINVLDPLIKYAGRPGDWGRESKLGLLTQRLLQVRQELAQGEIQEGSSV